MQNSLLYNYWERSLYEKETWDFIIVGAGFSGLSAAIHLKSEFPHATVLVIDSLINQSRASSRNAGFLCLGSPSELISDFETLQESLISEHKAYNLLSKRIKLRYKGYQWILNHIDRKKIHLNLSGGYEMFKSPEEFEHVAENMTFLGELYASANINENFEFKTSPLFHTTQPIIHWNNEGQLNPALLRKELIDKAGKSGVQFLLGHHVLNYEKGSQYILTLSKQLHIECTHLILAHNSLASHLEPETSIQSARNMILLTEELENLPFTGNFHYNRGYTYFRNVGKRLLIGGGRDLAIETETTEIEQFNENILTYLSEFSNTHILPTKKMKNIIAEKWVGFIGIRPLEEPYLTSEKNLISFGGYNGIGVGTAISLGEEIVEYFR